MSEVPHKAFWRMMEDALGSGCAGALRAALEKEPSVSVRLNPFKQPSPGPAFPEGEKVPWAQDGLMLKERPSFTLDPLLHAGGYYVQDSSAMAVGEVLRRCLEGEVPEGRPIRVLDACAAPGGKTTHAASVLRSRFGNAFLLVANEVMRQRASVLKDNVALWGDPCVSVTSCDPSAFGSREGFFDVIIADVPCSGEGMFRKDPGAVRDWSEDAVALCTPRGRRIMGDLWPSLCDGGLFIYSTCTFNRFENAGQVEWIESELGARVVTPPMPYEGFVAAGGGYALVPGLVPGEGQFVAALRKTEGKRNPYPLKAAPRSTASLPGDWLNVPCRLYDRGDTVIAVPETIAAEVAALHPLHPLSAGTAAGTFKGKDFVPSADLALSLLLDRTACPAVEADRETALRFLHREALVLPDLPKGILRLDWRGLPLGFVKNVGSRCNNLLPGSRRIRMDI